MCNVNPTLSLVSFYSFTKTFVTFYIDSQFIFLLLMINKTESEHRIIA